MDNSPVIKLNFYDPCTWTVEEYEEVRKDLLARYFVGIANNPGDRVLAKLIVDHEWRYQEIMRSKHKHLTPDNY